MSRRLALKSECKKQLMAIRSGSVATRKNRQFIIESMIDAWTTLRILPPSINKVEHIHIASLVNRWLSHDLSHTSIQNRLAVIRRFLMHSGATFTVPDNATFCKANPPSHNTRTTFLRPNILNYPLSALSQHLLGLQASLGLTEKEAANMHVIHRINHCFFVSKSIAFNKRARYIPVVSDEQKEILYRAEAFLKQHQSFFMLNPTDDIMAAVRTELSFHVSLKIGAYSLRHIYSKRRFNDLHTRHDKKEVMRIIRHELGLSRNVERCIPILSQAQRDALDAAKARVASHASLIPQDKRYVDQLNTYIKASKECNLKNLHGLRHAYAQRRFKAITGFDPPIKGRPKGQSLTKDQRQRDQHARKIIAEELGHSRITICKIYCG
jgi:hypothetical protein